MTIKSYLVKQVKERNSNQQWTQTIAVATATILTFVSGHFQAWPSPSIPKLISNSSYISMTFEETSYFAVIHAISMSAFCPFCGYILSRFGRKKSVLLSTIPQLLGWLVVGFSINSIMLHFSRVLAGISDAMIYMVLPVYVGEITEKRLRGPLGCLLMINFFSGQIVMNALGYYVDIPTSAFILSLFPIVNFLLFVWMPESPYWLIERGRLEEAKEELQVLRLRKNVDEEFDEIQKAVERQLSEKSSFKDLFSSKCNRKAFFIAVIARVTQQFAGINAFITYMQYIFEEAGGDLPSHISSIICMALMTSGAFVASRLIDKFGRKPLMMVSGVGSVITLFCQALYFYLKTVVDTSTVSWLPLAITLVYMALFSVGFCIVPTLLLGELFSASIKSKAVVLLNIIFGLAILIVTKIFQILADYVGMYAPFLFFCAATIIFMTILSFIFVETKNKTLEEIQQELKRDKPK